MSKLVDEILYYDAQMKAEKQFYESVFQDIIDYVVTHHPNITGATTPGKERGKLQYDGTPRSALNIATSGIHGLMVSPNIRWFRLRLSDEDLNKRSDVRTWLQDTEERMYGAFARSNFYAEMKSYIRDGLSVGTANMFIYESVGDGAVYFRTVPIGEYKIAENANKVVDRVHRDFKMTLKQIVETFGEDRLPERMKSALRDGSSRRMLEKFTIKHAVFPRKKYDPNKLDALNKPWVSVYLAIGDSTMGTGGQVDVLSKGGYDEFPYAIWRFDKETDEIYGRSPAWHVLPEIKGIHLLEKDLMKAAELAVNPPMNVHVNMRKNFKRIPGGINYFKNPEEKADAMHTGINYPVGLEESNRKRQIINEAYFVDFFLLIASREGTMTATEVLELQGEKISILAPAITSLSSEALDKIIDRMFSIELNAGRLSPPPDVLRGQSIDIDYIGPLAQAQRRAFETQGIMRSFEMARPIFEFMPQTLQNINWDKTVKEILRSGGFPEGDLRTDDEVESIRQAQAKREAELLQMQQSEVQAKNIKNLAMADKASGGKLKEVVSGT